MSEDDPAPESCPAEWPVGDGPACPGYTTHRCYIQSPEHNQSYGCARATHRCLCGEVTS